MSILMSTEDMSPTEFYNSFEKFTGHTFTDCMRESELDNVLDGHRFDTEKGTFLYYFEPNEKYGTNCFLKKLK